MLTHNISYAFRYMFLARCSCKSQSGENSYTKHHYIALVLTFLIIYYSNYNRSAPINCNLRRQCPCINCKLECFIFFIYIIISYINCKASSSVVWRKNNIICSISIITFCRIRNILYEQSTNSGDTLDMMMVEILIWWRHKHQSFSVWYNSTRNLET